MTSDERRQQRCPLTCFGQRVVRYLRDLQRSYDSLECCLYTWVLFMYRYEVQPHSPAHVEMRSGEAGVFEEAGSLLARDFMLNSDSLQDFYQNSWHRQDYR